jgi:hypothetical protein
MAGADDEIEKLLREVDSALGGTAPRPSARPARTGGGGGGAVERPDAAGFMQAAVPRATAIGAVWGVGVGGVFAVLPFVSSFSGAVGAFVTGFSVSILGRWRRR